MDTNSVHTGNSWLYFQHPTTVANLIVLVRWWVSMRTWMCLFQILKPPQARNLSRFPEDLLCICFLCIPQPWLPRADPYTWKMRQPLKLLGRRWEGRQATATAAHLSPFWPHPLELPAKIVSYGETWMNILHNILVKTIQLEIVAYAILTAYASTFTKITWLHVSPDRLNTHTHTHITMEC